MSNIQGLDVGEVQGLAKKLTTAAGQIQGIMNQLNGALNNSGQIWRGPDQARFLHDWQTTHCSQLNNVINGLTTAAATATRNASAQQTTSSTL